MHDAKDIKEFKQMLEKSVAISKNGIVVIDKTNNAEKHTEEIQEIITKVPSWIVRWGITLLFSSLLIIVAISALIPYPEMIKLPLKLQSLGATASIKADASGRITKVFVKKNMIVKQGQPLIEVQKDIDQKTYILKALTDGRVGFLAIIQPGSIVAQNQEMIKIHPVGNHFFGLMQISKNDIGKVKVGQDVLIKPTGSFSMVNNAMQGKIEFVADEPVNNHFYAKVAFTTPTTRNGNFEIKSWMDFEAEIITKKSNLFYKLFGSVIDAYKVE